MERKILRPLWLLSLAGPLMWAPALRAETPSESIWSASATCDALLYCAKNLRTLPSEVAAMGRDIVANNAVAVLVCIGGHGKPVPKTESNDVPPTPKDGGGDTGQGGTPDPGPGNPGGGKNYPEPSAMVLGLIGAASLTIYRKRRSKASKP